VKDVTEMVFFMLKGKVSIKALFISGAILSVSFVVISCFWYHLHNPPIRGFLGVPGSYCRALEYGSTYIDPSIDANYRSVIGKDLVLELSFAGRTEDAGKLAELMMNLECGYQGRLIRSEIIAELFDLYGSADRLFKLSPSQFSKFYKPAKTKADFIYQKYMGSKKGTPFSRAFGRSGFRVDRIYGILAKSYKAHGCNQDYIDCLKMAIQAVKEELGTDSSQYHAYLFQLAEALHAQGKDSDAKALLNQSVARLTDYKYEGDDVGYKNEEIDRVFRQAHYERCHRLLQELETKDRVKSFFRSASL